MTWYIVRHAHKEKGGYYNPQLRHQDEPLSPEGREGARELADYFGGKPIATIYISAYQRTRQTTADLAERLALMPVIDERLNEIDNGQAGAMSEEQFQQAFPAEWEAFVSRERDFRFPGGETGQEASDRIVSFMEEKRRQHAGQDILVVSHEGLIRLWMCTLMGLPVYRRGDFSIDFCGLLETDYQPEYERWKLIRFNQAIADKG